MARSALLSPEEVARLVQQHQAGLWRYLRALGCEPSLAEDLVQETFVRVLQHPVELRSDASTAAYLRRVARNLAISAYRKDRRLQLVGDVELLDRVWENWAGQDDGQWLLAALRRCWEKLRQRAQLALRLRFEHQLPRAEIARRLEMTEHGAKNLMQRAKKTLRDCIQRQQQS